MQLLFECPVWSALICTTVLPLGGGKVELRPYSNIDSFTLTFYLYSIVIHKYSSTFPKSLQVGFLFFQIYCPSPLLCLKRCISS